MVNVSSANKKIKVSVSAKKNINAVDSSNNMARFYQELAQEWATSDSIVENTDYSSKYYAEKSKNSAEISANLLEQTKTEAETALNNIHDSRAAAISAIDTAEATAIENIETETTDSINSVIAEGTTQRELLNADVSSAKKAAEEANISAENTATSESNALAYKNSALASKEAASASEANAKESETKAAASENNALAYKNSALESSQTATSKADIATTKAKEASTSASSASASMTSASNYAAQAKKAAEEAISGQLQADFSQTNSSAKDFIKNKPTKLSDFTDNLGSSPTHTHNQYLKEADTIKVQEISQEEYLALKKKDANTLYVVCTQLLVWGTSAWGVGVWSLQDE